MILSRKEFMMTQIWPTNTCRLSLPSFTMGLSLVARAHSITHALCIRNHNGRRIFDWDRSCCWCTLKCAVSAVPKTNIRSCECIDNMSILHGRCQFLYPLITHVFHFKIQNRPLEYLYHWAPVLNSWMCPKSCLSSELSSWLLGLITRTYAYICMA